MVLGHGIDLCCWGGVDAAQQHFALALLLGLELDLDY